MWLCVVNVFFFSNFKIIMPTVPGSIQSKPKPRQFSATGIRTERTRIVSQSHQRPCNLSNQHERRNQSRLQEHCSTYTKMGSALDWRHMLQNYICYSNNYNLLHAPRKNKIPSGLPREKLPGSGPIIRMSQPKVGCTEHCTSLGRGMELCTLVLYTPSIYNNKE